MKELEALALAHLKSQLNDHVIIHELFSSFTSRYEKVQQVEMEYLIRRWAHLKDLAEFSSKFDEFSNGTLPHCGWLMKELMKRTTSLSVA
jgi:hypothetical protein